MNISRRTLLGGGVATATALVASNLLVGASATPRGPDKRRSIQKESAMIEILRAASRFHTRIEWLDSYHSFSFGEHYDPQRLGFRALRVINDDRIAAGGGFPTHGHREMEIITYLVEGELEHKDSTGQGGIIRPGQVQYMSAGTGIRHSEFNPSKQTPTRLLQIWIEPGIRGLAPAYAQSDLGSETLQLVASPDGSGGSLRIRQDCRLYAAKLGANASLELPVLRQRHAWVQVVRGQLALDDNLLVEGDGVAVSATSSLTLRTDQPAEVLIFDLA